MTDTLSPGATIGILGGGQLGRMLSLAAARLGLKCHIYDPAPNPPAGHVADAVTTAGWEDKAALTNFAKSVDVVTYEFENVPTASLDLIESIVPIHPGRRALATSQDRLTEKTFLADLGLKTAPFAPVNSLDDLHAALADMQSPGILKTRRFGYDGKGQSRIMSPDQVGQAWTDMADAPSILEGFVEFTREISVIAARGVDGRVSCYDPGENVHENGILRTTTVPANISIRQKTDAVLLAGRILNALDYVGVLGVELFVTPTGLIVNEIAPRVHNSGHWTQDACIIDQFEQHIRAVAGWPLGDGSRHSDAVMENLIGDEAGNWPDLATSGAALHLYGKAEARPGRKMGHINRLSPMR